MKSLPILKSSQVNHNKCIWKKWVHDLYTADSQKLSVVWKTKKEQNKTLRSYRSLKNMNKKCQAVNYYVNQRRSFRQMQYQS